MSLQSLDRALSKTTDRSVGDIVAAYGSNIQKLKMDAATGKIDPTKAVMAMMAIQRIVAANTQPPPGTTVAQDTGIAPPPEQMGMPAILPSVTPAAPQQPPLRMAYGGQVAVSNNQVPSPAMERGLDGIPIPDNMFDYAEGGMIAFGDGGDVKRFQAAGAVNLSQALPPFSFSSDVEFRKLLDSLARSGSYQQLDELLSKMPESDPRHAQIKQAADAARAATAYTPPSMQPRGAPPIPGSIGPYTAPPMQGAAVPNVPGLTPAPVERSGVYKAGQAVGRGLSGMGKLLSEGLVSTAPKAAGALSVLPYALEARDLNVGEEGTLQGLAIQRLKSLGYTDEQINKIPRNELTRAAASATQVVQQAEAPQVDTTKKDTKAEEKAAVDTAVSEARRIIGPTPKLDMPKAPALLDVPKPKTLKEEIEIAQPLAKEMYQDHPEAKKTLDDILKGDKETLAKQGYDFDMIKNMVAETRAEREKIPAQRKEAANLRLLEAGLAIMGGSSPYAFVNIGKGGSEAAKGFNEDMKEFRKLDREYRKELQQLQSMQNQETLMLTTEGKKRYERIQDKVRDTEDKRANAAFQMGQNAVNSAAKREETALTLNNATSRTIYQTEADLRKAQAQMESQTNIALAQIGAQGRSELFKQQREDAMIDQIMADANAAGKPITRSEAFERYNQMRTGLGAYRAEQNKIAEQRIRASVVNKIDEPTLRINIAKGMGLKSAPPPGANAAFDNKVKEEIERIVQRALQAEVGGTRTSGLSDDYRILPPER